MILDFTQSTSAKPISYPAPIERGPDGCIHAIVAPFLEAFGEPYAWRIRVDPETGGAWVWVNRGRGGMPNMVWTPFIIAHRSSNNRGRMYHIFRRDLRGKPALAIGLQAHRVMYALAHGWDPINARQMRGQDIHHRDNDPTNNRLENLQLLSKADHRLVHGVRRADELWSMPKPKPTRRTLWGAE